MKPERRKWMLSMGAIVQVSLLLMAIALPSIQGWLALTQTGSDDLRLLRLERLRLVRSQGTLLENLEIVESVAQQAETVDSITLSLIEAIKQYTSAQQLELSQLSVTLPGDAENANTNDVMRVRFSVTMARAVGLLALFDVVQYAVGWRPIEIRGCSVARVEAVSSELLASCSVDVYYFPEVDR